MNKRKHYIIKSIRMMSELIKRDFRLYKVIDDKDNPQFKVFLFNDTPELRQAITEIDNEWSK